MPGGSEVAICLEPKKLVGDMNINRRSIAGISFVVIASPVFQEQAAAPAKMESFTGKTVNFNTDAGMRRRIFECS